MAFKTPEEKNLYAYHNEIVIRHVKGSISLSYFVAKLIANGYDACYYKSGKGKSRLPNYLLKKWL